MKVQTELPEKTLPLLATKFYIPRPRLKLVTRPQLIDCLNAGLERSLTLLSAPPGFGKTTLLSEWCAQAAQKVAWVSLDPDDDYPSRFWAYVIAAMYKVLPDLGDQALLRLQSSNVGSLNSILIDLINSISAAKERFILVLDDFHNITSEAVLTTLRFLLDHQPAQLHLVLSTRADPLLPLAQLRARGELSELRADDLRFTLPETIQFFNRSAGFNISEHDIAALEARTEGWITGLQLAALSMQERQDRSGFIADFSGSHRFVLDYLSDQVLQTLPENVRHFLFQTAILDRLCAPLCDAVTGITGSQSILETLDQGNLFLIPLDNNRGWYRYHHLFADVLRHRLNDEEPGHLLELHCRASQWYEHEGMLPQAITHALAAKDFDLAARLLERIMDMFWQVGEIMLLNEWMQALPKGIRQSHPALYLEYGRFLVESGQFSAAETLVREIEQDLEIAQVTNVDELAALCGQIAAIDAYLVKTRGEFGLAIDYAQKALDLLRPEQTRWRGFGALCLAGAYSFTSRWEEASQTYLEAAAFCRASGNRADALSALSQRGEILQAQGQLRLAAQEYEQVLQQSRDWNIPYTPANGYALTGLGRVWCEWNDLDAAENYARSGLEFGRRADILDVILRGTLALARIRKARGDSESALTLLKEVEPVAERMGVSEIKDWVQALRAQIWLEQGNTEEAIRWASNFQGSFHAVVYPAVPVVIARILFAQDRLEESLALLDRTYAAAQQSGRMGNTIQILVVKALALRKQGELDQALFHLEHALALAEPEGYLRVFVDEGSALVHLLYRAAQRRPGSAFVHALLKALGSPFPPVAANPGNLVEPLTERETQILQLISDGATNQEIANELVLTLNTVKKHTSNIFGKLGVNNRTQAIAQARQNGLL